MMKDTNAGQKQNTGTGIKTSQIYALMKKAKNYENRIELGRGDPDFDTPEPVLIKTEANLSGSKADQIPVEGIFDLREAIAERVERINGIKVDPDTEVIVTNGGQEALFMMVQSVIDKNDEIILPEPNYNTYKDAINFAGGVRIGIPTRREQSFRVDPRLVEKAVTPRTRAIVLASPNNPSGAVISPEDHREFVAIAVHHHLKILSDEIYDYFVYGDLEHISPATLPGGRERTITLNAVSKKYAMCGWRTGWLVGDAELIKPIKELKAAINGGTSLISQLGALSALNTDDSEILGMKKSLIRRRTIVMKSLDRINIPYGIPQGGQFIFADISSLKMGSLAFCEWILENCQVLLYPGATYGIDFDNYLRITFLQNESMLEEAMSRIEQLFKKEGLC
jgi:aminotransferase